MSDDQEIRKEPDTEIECPECGLCIGFHLETLIEEAQERNISIPKEPSKIPKALPIFFKGNYEAKNCVGTAHYDNGSLLVSLFDGYTLSKDEIFQYFGNITFIPELQIKDRYASFRIKTFSINMRLPRPEPEEDESEPC